MAWSALLLSLKLSVIVSAVLLVIALPLGAWIAFSKARWKFLLESVVALPLVLPPTVLGFYVLVAIGPLSPVGRWYASLTGHTMAFTFEGLVFGSVLYSLPFAVQPMAAGFAAVDRTLLFAAATLGAAPFEVFRRVVLPLSKNAILTGVMLAFAHTLGEFGVVLMIGGNIPGQTQTVSIAIYDFVQALDYRAANQTALLLLAISFVILSLVYGLNRSKWVVWPWR
ncbi:Molybdate ABC transporter, inner membrane subunit [Candidatus Koribacter versatilis Ellin345]|uniref:Molybdenum transport system permease n=1 Tax=Koribacter versatilis (strain Ellin345) TaxID=204669 RepID=Q1IQH2_KORVE|nr:molybdate ABC transporter permease subunit [Candidatus Koribacter versatilis]ABF40878.1 Molybdate ABC transporter, inner membrane subunit [Candidatus Koribacter versatilis Ellin345]